MQIMTRHWVAAGIGLLVAILAAFGWFDFAKAPSVAPPSAELDTASSTDLATPQGEPPAKSQKQLAMSPLDAITSWSFKGAYTNNDALVQKADAEIARLTALLGTGAYTDYILYVSIANQYDLLGDGGNEFAYLQKALAEDSTNTGLAWYNAGQLFTRLGAYRTARTAFERAVAAEPIPQYERALADFLAAHYPGE